VLGCVRRILTLQSLNEESNPATHIIILMDNYVTRKLRSAGHIEWGRYIHSFSWETSWKASTYSYGVSSRQPASQQSSTVCV
jgi:hypothetical protein